MATCYLIIKKSYPTKAESRILGFVINDIFKIKKDSYWVLSDHHLTLPNGDSNGVFMTVFKTINGIWKIDIDLSY